MREIPFLDIIINSVREIVYFPIWWYSRGARKVIVFCLTKAYRGWQASALPILLRNFFKPMYGQKGWDAYILSMFGRIIQVFFRFVFVTVWGLLWLAVFLSWIFFPVFILYHFY